jgi:nucleoside-diphosphate-sugar epimerase
MPAVYPPSKVLVSGANGFVGIWVVRKLLQRGYRVRGTVRSLDKGDDLKKAFEAYKDRFEIVVVEDITQVSFRRFRVPLLTFKELSW